MTKRACGVALLLAFAICLVVLFSTCCIAVRADHDCIGEGCSVCCQISSYRQTLNSLALAVWSACAIAAFASHLSARLLLLTELKSANTLIMLKVELLN